MSYKIDACALMNALLETWPELIFDLSTTGDSIHGNDRTGVRGTSFGPLDVPAASVSIGDNSISPTTQMNSLRSVWISSLIISPFLFFNSVRPAQAAQELISGSIQEMMSPEEFKAAGLNKLSPEELQKLDAWLQGYREATEKRTEKKVTKSFFNREPVVSRVDGSFAGLRGRTLIKLEDGTVWKQANLDDHVGPSPIDHPGAAVVWSGFGYKMRIQGVPEFYVNPVKTP